MTRSPPLPTAHWHFPRDYQSLCFHAPSYPLTYSELTTRPPHSHCPDQLHGSARRPCEPALYPVPLPAQVVLYYQQTKMQKRLDTEREQKELAEMRAKLGIDESNAA